MGLGLVYQADFVGPTGEDGGGGDSQGPTGRGRLGGRAEGQWGNVLVFFVPCSLAMWPGFEGLSAMPRSMPIRTG